MTRSRDCDEAFPVVQARALEQSGASVVGRHSRWLNIEANKATPMAPLDAARLVTSEFSKLCPSTTTATKCLANKRLRIDGRVSNCFTQATLFARGKSPFRWDGVSSWSVNQQHLSALIWGARIWEQSLRLVLQEESDDYCYSTRIFCMRWYRLGLQCLATPS